MSSKEAAGPTSPAFLFLVVIPNSFAEGEGERDPTLRLHHHERKQDCLQRIAAFDLPSCESVLPAV
jgi:hypothetical protein